MELNTAPCCHPAKNIDCAGLTMSRNPKSDEPLAQMDRITKKMKSTDALGGLKPIIESKNRKRAAVTERLRRNRMQCLCAKLESLIPTTLTKVDRSDLLEDAGNYIKELQDQLTQLKRKRECFQARLREKTVKERIEVTKVDVEVKERESVIIISSIRRPRQFWRVIKEFASSEFFICLYLHATFTEGMKEVDPAKVQCSLKTRLLAVY